MKKVFLSLMLMFSVSFAFATEKAEVNENTNFYLKEPSLETISSKAKLVDQSCYALSCRVICFPNDQDCDGDIEATFDILEYFFCEDGEGCFDEC